MIRQLTADVVGNGRRCAAAIGLAIAIAVPAEAADYAIVYAGKLLAKPGEAPLTNQTVVIKDGVVDRVAAGQLTADDLGTEDPDSVRIYDLSEFFVLPGLTDGHVHITSELGPDGKVAYVERSDPDWAIVGAGYARKTLMAGFTTVRDLGARGGDAVFALRDGIARGDVVGPRIFASGDTISPTGGHGQAHGYRDDVMHLLHSTGVCDGAAECRKAVRTQVRRSADHIKLVATGGVLSETAAGTGQQFFEDELKAIMDTAHSLGRKVTAHAHGADGINSALRAGVDSIEHGSFANEESFDLMKEKGAYLVPTILAGVTVAEIANDPESFFPAPIRAKAKQVGPQIIDTVRKAHAAGVPIAFGTDTGVSKHGDNAREFELLVEAGLTPMEAIAAATVKIADNMGRSAMLGTVEPGKVGDLVAVNGDPLNSISELRDIDFVMKDGVAYKTP
ncbi:MAG: amidohydrolase family protein [Alphaproteobacteria bacterium]|nr:amidohydrolase family protein [Alphaproteobacteria bacterium]